MLGALFSCVLWSEQPQTFSLKEQEFLLQQQRILERALIASPQASTQIRAWSSRDLQTWTAQKDPPLHSLSSLGLHHEDGNIVLSAQHRLQMPTKEEEEMQLLWSQLLHFDGVAWRAEVRPFSAPISAHADHQWFEGELWLQSSPPLFRGGAGAVAPDQLGAARDPLLLKVDHEIRTPDRVWLSGVGLADPAPLRFKGDLHLFVTRAEIHNQELRLSVEHYVEQDGQLEKKSVFSGRSVPFALEVNGEMWLLAQQRTRSGAQLVSSRTADGVSWSSWAPLLSSELERSCSSPVMGRVGEKWWIFCVEQR